MSASGWKRSFYMFRSDGSYVACFTNSANCPLVSFRPPRLPPMFHRELRIGQKFYHPPLDFRRADPKYVNVINIHITQPRKDTSYVNARNLVLFH